MSAWNPDDPDFEDYPDTIPWDPRYGGGPGDMYDPPPVEPVDLPEQEGR